MVNTLHIVITVILTGFNMASGYITNQVTKGIISKLYLSLY